MSAMGGWERNNLILLGVILHADDGQIVSGVNVFEMDGQRLTEVSLRFIDQAITFRLNCRTGRPTQ
jgi:hypothetical protein